MHQTCSIPGVNRMIPVGLLLSSEFSQDGCPPDCWASWNARDKLPARTCKEAGPFPFTCPCLALISARRMLHNPEKHSRFKLQ